MSGKRYKALVSSSLGLSLLAWAASAGAPGPEGIETRVQTLVKAMTLEEKAQLTSGNGRSGYIGYLPGIKRLGIPAMAMTDGPAGVRNGTATSFPAPIALASSWNPELISEVGESMGIESKAKGQQVLLGPCINILRVPQGGRSFEGYGEDPFLVGKLAAAFIRGVQSEGVIACAKHYALNNQETQRGSISSEVDERTLREIYLPAFKAAVQEGGVWSVMAAYNRYEGTYCSENDYLQNRILKGEWGFKGFVVSDWGATHSSVKAAKNGLDIEMPTGQFFGKLATSVANGSMDVKTLDGMVTRTLRAQLALDQWNPDWAKGAKANTPATQAVSLKAAREGIVLLKNKDNILPLDSRVKSIAVIGPSAAVNRYCGGGSAWVDPPYTVSPLQAITAMAKERGIKITYSQGTSLKAELQTIPDSALSPAGGNPDQKGLKAEYFGNRTLSGKPYLTRIDGNVDFDWKDGTPAPGLPYDNFSVRWTGTISAPVSGTYTFGGTSDDGMRIWIDGKPVVNNWSDHASETATGTITLEAGKKYSIKAEYYENGGMANAALGWSKPGASMLGDAVQAAKDADIALVFVGTSSDVESEGFDRADLKLPGRQDALISEVSKVNKRTAVILSTGSAILMDKWVDSTPAVMQAWFPGMEGGTAIAEVLFGKVNPSGKLPMTYPKKWEDSAAFGNFPGDGNEVVYSEGILVGYRHFDTKGIEPLFPFGHGLSYTTFKYGEPIIAGVTDSSKPTVTVSLDVTNNGRVEGAEVIQLYVKDDKSSLPRPDKELKAFRKISLKPGETQRVDFLLQGDAFAYYDPEKSAWVTEPGDFGILIGSSSKDIRAKGHLVLK